MFCKAVFVLVANACVGHRNRANLQHDIYDLRGAGANAVTCEILDSCRGRERSLHAFGNERASACVEVDFEFPDVLRLVVELYALHVCRNIGPVNHERPFRRRFLHGFAELDINEVACCGRKPFEYRNGHEIRRNAILVEVGGFLLAILRVAYKRDASFGVRVHGGAREVCTHDNVPAVLRNQVCARDGIASVGKLDGVERLVVCCGVFVG